MGEARESTARIEALDILRGIAVLGIMLVNIHGMGSVPGVASDPRISGWDTADQIVWWVQQLFVEGTMRGLLSLLFGAGFVIIATRPQAGRSALSIYYRRMVSLVLLGLIHSYLLMWPGDILLIYGLAGLFLFPFRDLPARALIGLGLGGIALITAIGAAAVVEGMNTREHAEAAIAGGAGDDDERIVAWQGYLDAVRPDLQADVDSRAARQGSLADNLAYKATIASKWNSPAGLSWWALDALAMMLIGAGLFKVGFLGGAFTRATYLKFALAGYAVGVPINLIETEQMVAAGFVVPIPVAEVTHQIGRLATTLGHAGLVLAALHTLRGRRLLGVFSAPGRMALSTYIGETMIAQWILFPGFALGLHGTMSIAESWLIALGIAVVLVLADTWWLRRFRTGPLEWLWRRLTYGRRPVLRT
ncbi:DUF418 domain-containing protein [Sphingosinicella soli]|uniref:DUF418 domain-containing protein n=1 Tax=Sphingosinicella soli TaxID=333708 RepID=A0A7W7F8I0_9SPHN|nr:DUF418 domain-containing protein [Sphingosinicella soli]MBB4633739.1 uncharacterized protein [Sphingosinicella soli]